MKLTDDAQGLYGLSVIPSPTEGVYKMWRGGKSAGRYALWYSTLRAE